MKAITIHKNHGITIYPAEMKVGEHYDVGDDLVAIKNKDGSLDILELIKLETETHGLTTWHNTTTWRHRQ